MRIPVEYDCIGNTPFKAPRANFFITFNAKRSLRCLFLYITRTDKFSVKLSSNPQTITVFSTAYTATLQGELGAYHAVWWRISRKTAPAAEGAFDAFMCKVQTLPRNQILCHAALKMSRLPHCCLPTIHLIRMGSNQCWDSNFLGTGSLTPGLTYNRFSHYHSLQSRGEFSFSGFYFRLGALLECSRRLLSYKLVLHVLVTFTEQVVLIHKHITVGLLHSEFPR